MDYSSETHSRVEMKRRRLWAWLAIVRETSARLALSTSICFLRFECAVLRFFLKAGQRAPSRQRAGWAYDSALSSVRTRSPIERQA